MNKGCDNCRYNYVCAWQYPCNECHDYENWDKQDKEQGDNEADREPKEAKT